MKSIKWNDATFSVGIKKIDDQHKLLVGLLNSLIQNKNAEDREFVPKVFTTLLLYIRNHFTDEEKILRKMNFPGFKEHAQQHQNFVNRIIAMKSEYESSKRSPEVLDSLLKFLSDWLTTHILQQDKAYSNYLFS